VLVAALALAAACSKPPPSGDDGGFQPVYAIDAGFLFGAGTLAYPNEGGNDAADWRTWEQIPLPIGDGGSDAGASDGGCRVLGCAQADDGPDHYSQFAQDLGLARGLGLNAYRFSLSWSRLRPSADGGYDPTALAHYHSVLDACQSNGMTPLVTLTDFSLPGWLQGVTSGQSGATDADWVGGWRGLAGEVPGPDAGIVREFARYAADMAAEYGGQVDLWITLSSPSTLMNGAFVDGVYPPGAQNHLTDMRNALINLAYANGAAYDAIHRNDTVAVTDGGIAALVGVSQELRDYLPADAGTTSDQVNQTSYIDNWLFLFAVVNGDLDTHFDGLYYHPGDGQGEGRGLLGLAGRVDFLGINFYGSAVVYGVDGGVQDAQGSSLTLPGTVGENPDPNVPHGDPPQSIAIDPMGFQSLLVLTHELFPLSPIYVTENGVADSAQPDTIRPAFVVQHVQAIQQAMAQGVPVLGYFPWSLIDGYQWNNGFAPRYGLFHVDFTDPTRPRTATQGSVAYSQIVGALGVTPAIAAEWVK
jgi:beta-glucosidase